MQLRIIIPKVQHWSIHCCMRDAVGHNCLLMFSPFFALLCLPQRQKQKKTQWSKAERCDSTGKGKRLENQGLSIRVYSYKLWTGDFNKLSIWRYRSGLSWQRRWVSLRHRQVHGAEPHIAPLCRSVQTQHSCVFVVVVVVMYLFGVLFNYMYIYYIHFIDVDLISWNLQRA